MRIVFKTYILIFLVTLPVNFLAILHSHKFANFSLANKQSVREVFKQRVVNAKSNKHQPMLNDSPMAPFYVPHLRDPTTWWMSLGGPWSNVTDDSVVPREEDVSKYASLDRLYHEMCEAQTWHHWVYLSQRPAEAEDGLFDEWDEAFDRLI